jgi:acetolactate synthase-1/2/3 large subunit
MVVSTLASSDAKGEFIGADVIADAFVRHNIDRVHVFPGGTIAPILSATIARGIDVFTARHEQGAGYSALASARLSGQPQVCMATSGPGVTNLVTVVADAYFDSTPLVVITGQVGTADLARSNAVRQRGFQEVDTVALLRPISKTQILPLDPNELADAMENAFRIAADGRPGPVVIDIPMDVQRGPVTPSPLFDGSNHQREREDQDEPIADSFLDEAARILARAKRPLIIAGQGVLLARAESQLRDLVDRRGWPVSHSLLGLGALPSNNPDALGYHGHTGNQTAGLAIHNADALLILGSRLDVRQTGTLTDSFAPGASIVRVEADQSELEHSRIRSDVTIHGDVRSALDALCSRLDREPTTDISAWKQQIADWRDDFPLSFDASSAFKPQTVIKTADRLTAGQSAVTVTGVGSHQQWVARHFSFDFPTRPLLTSGGHGAMGYDLPSAVGAQLERPESPVLCFVGDGSFQINIQELASIVDRDLPIKIIVLDNHRLGIVSQFQLFNWNDDPTCGDKWNPDFASIARAYGIESWTVRTEAEVEPALSAALALPGPALVHCIIDPVEDVMPMLMAGQTMDKMWPYDQE